MMKYCKICMRPNFESEGVIKNNILYIKKADGSLGLLNEEDDYGILCDYYAVAGLVQICAGGKWGFADIHTGRVRVDPVWDYADGYYDGRLAVVAEGCKSMTCEDMLASKGPWGGRRGCIDLSGNVAIPVAYDRIRCANESLYDKRGPFKNMIIVERDGLQGIVDLSNRELLPIKYHSVIVIQDGVFLCVDAMDKGIRLLHGNRVVFSGADRVYRKTWEHVNENKKAYFIARKRQKFAVFCDDGRMITDFTLLFRDAKNITKKLSGGSKFRPWLAI
jgi:hypothetical protein